MFILPFNKFNNKEGYNNNFKNFSKLKENKLDLNLNKEILLFKDDFNLDFELKEVSSQNSPYKAFKALPYKDSRYSILASYIKC
jgi:hypothetical protein